MKKKAIFTFVALFIFVSVVCAKVMDFSFSTTLQYNDKTDASRGEAELGVDFRTYMESIQIQGNAPKMKTTCQRKNLLIWKETGSTSHQLSKTTTSVVDNWTTNKTATTRVFWQNQTQGSKITAKFGAKNN